MSRSETEIKNILEKILRIKFEELESEPSSDSLDSWDSLVHMKIVLSLEETFSIHFSEKDIERITSYSLIKTVVQEKLSD